MLSSHHARFAPRASFAPNGETSTTEKAVQGREAYRERGVRRREAYTAKRPVQRREVHAFRRLHAFPPTSRHSADFTRPSADFTPSRRLDAFSPSSRLFAEIVPPEFIPLAELIPRRVDAFRRERECASPEVGSEFGRSPPLFLWAASWLRGERRPFVPAGHASRGKVRALAHPAGPGGNFSRPQVPGKISREPSEAGSARQEP